MAAWAGHELGVSAAHQCRWAVVVWAARCRDDVMSSCELCLVLRLPVVSRQIYLVKGTKHCHFESAFDDPLQAKCRQCWRHSTVFLSSGATRAADEPCATVQLPTGSTAVVLGPGPLYLVGRNYSARCAYIRVYTHIRAHTCISSLSACAVVCVIQMFLWHQCTHLRHICCKLCTYVYVKIYVYVHAYVYGCVCAFMILFDALRRHCWDFLSVYRYSCTCMCICVCTYACICACAYVCICIYVCLCICMYIHVYAHACGCTYALV